jgi:hypothetical protein
MTEEKMQTLKDDIAFMRALAQEGSAVPLLFGGVMVAAGLIFGVASVLQWMMTSGVLVVPSDWFLLANWVVAGVAFAVALNILLRRAKSRPGFNGSVNKATGAAWSGVGFAIFSSWAGMTAIGLTTGDWKVMNMFPVLILALYGAAWFVAAVMSGKGWIKLIALGSFVGAAGMGALAASPHLMLGYAACLVVLAVIPGLVLIHQEPTDVV